MEDNRIGGLGLVRTKDLMSYIERGLADENRTHEDKVGQAKFYVCGWDDLRDAGYTVKEYSSSSEFCNRGDYE